MADMPKLPQEISSDGREIWDWAGKLSEHVHRLDEIRRLNSRLVKVGTVCGDCDKWMKSSECPAERNVKGRTVGPSCESRKCMAFVETIYATKERITIKEKLAALQPPDASL